MFSFLVPSYVKEIGLALLAILLFILAGWGYGKWEYHKGVVSVRAQEKATILITQAKSEAISTNIVTNYIPVIRTIHETGKTIVKEVPIYVTHEDDSRCLVGDDFVQLWNSTNKMLLPADSGSVSGAASSVVLSDIAAQHAREATIATDNEEKLIALQHWILEQQKAYQNK